MATPRQEALDLIEKHDAELLDDSADRTEFIATAWSPPSRVWRATASHSIAIHFYTDRPAGWVALRDDLRAGTMPCDAVRCDTCEEAEVTA